MCGMIRVLDMRVCVSRPRGGCRIFERGVKVRSTKVNYILGTCMDPFLISTPF